MVRLSSRSTPAVTCGCQKEFSNTMAEQLQPLYDEWEGKVIGSDLMNAYREYSGY